MCAFLKFVVSFLDISFGQGSETIDTELRDGEAGYSGAVDNGLPQYLGGELFYLVQITKEASGKAIPGPSGVLELVYGIGRSYKVIIVAEHDRSILTSLYDHRFRAHLENTSGSGKYIMALGKQARLRLIHDGDIHRTYGTGQGITFAPNPEVHGIHDLEPVRADLIQYLTLKIGIYIG